MGVEGLQHELWLCPPGSALSALAGAGQHHGLSFPGCSRTGARRPLLSLHHGSPQAGLRRPSNPTSRRHLLRPTWSLLPSTCRAVLRTSVTCFCLWGSTSVCSQFWCLRGLPGGGSVYVLRVPWAAAWSTWQLVPKASVWRDLCCLHWFTCQSWSSVGGHCAVQCLSSDSRDAPGASGSGRRVPAGTRRQWGGHEGSGTLKASRAQGSFGVPHRTGQGNWRLGLENPLGICDIERKEMGWWGEWGAGCGSPFKYGAGLDAGASGQDGAAGGGGRLVCSGAWGGGQAVGLGCLRAP